MKRITLAVVLALGLVAATADSARASGWGPGSFNFGINFTGSWGCGYGGCGAPAACPPQPAMYSAYPAPGYGGYPAPGYGGYGYGYGYGAPVDYSASYGHGYGYGY